MKYQFRTDIETKVPTCALIENYQDLSIAIQNGDWDLVEVVADCLADTINDYTIVPEGLTASTKSPAAARKSVGCG